MRSATSVLYFTIRGMHCASCAEKIERALRATPGVRDVSVNLATEKATVHGMELDPNAIFQAVEAFGYRVIAAEGPAARERAQADRDQERRALGRALGVSIAFSIPLLALSMIPMFSTRVDSLLRAHLGARGLLFILFALATPVQFGPGRRFYSAGWKALRQGSPDMNTLVMLGTSAAYFYSVVGTFAPSWLPPGGVHVYYETAAVIIALILGGKYMQSLAQDRAGEAIRRLADLNPKTARVLRNGSEEQIPVEQIHSGDIVSVRPGERVPCDGEIVQGESFVDESMITGEPMPARKFVDDPVIGGTINGLGAFRMRAEAVGTDTVLAHIIRMVEEAQSDKPPIQDLADKMMRYFVPAVLAAATLSFLLWLALVPGSLSQAVSHAIAVLIIACPCAMGLATPTAVLVATGKAAELGLLFRRGAALQALSEADIFVLDKTGTLTEGHPALSELHIAPDFERSEVLGLTATVEAASEHPIARAIVQAATHEGLKLPPAREFAALPGLGVQASVGERLVCVGSARYMENLGVDVEPLSEQTALMAQTAKTMIYSAVGGRAAAVFAIIDPLRPGSREAVAALKALKRRVAMLTGDSRATAQALARQAGIDDFQAEVPPQQKAAAVRSFQKQGRVVFVGDGINDAPALAQADVGVAIGTGADAAIETADVILLSGRLGGLPLAVALAAKTLRVIRQNLFWAFFYNVLLIPLAAGALAPVWQISLNPMLAAAAMSLSSVFVIGNSLRLRRFK